MSLVDEFMAAWRHDSTRSPCGAREDQSSDRADTVPLPMSGLYESERVQELKRVLSIQPPSFATRTMPISGQERSPVLLTFSRHRRISLPWSVSQVDRGGTFYLLLFLQDDCKGCASQGFLPTHVTRYDPRGERYWTFDARRFEERLAEEAKEAVPEVSKTDKRRVGGEGAAGSVAREGDIAAAQALQPAADTPAARLPWILRLQGRRYLVRTRSEDGDPTQTWDAVASLQPLAWAPEPAADKPVHVPWGFMEEVDLQPGLIVREYQRLDAERALAKSLQTAANALLKGLEPKTDGTIAPEVAERADETAAAYRKLSEPIREISEKLRVLKERAKRLGYYLPIDEDDDLSVSFPIGEKEWKTVTLKAGRLYRQSRQSVMCTYTIEVVRYYPDPFLLFHGPIIEKHTRELLRSYDHFEEMRHDREPWVDRREALTNAGFACLMTEQTESGYVCDNGVSLSDVMARCRVDEAFRERLAVFLPVYQQSLTVGMEKAKYLIAVRPMPGYEPTSFPEVFCEEQLSYRADWRGYQLGELLQSIGLAPGEEREVTISRSETSKTERVESITSVLDVTRSQRDDLQTSLENRASREQTSKNTSNWNVNASGSLFGFSAGGGGGGSSEQTSREFAEDIRRMATSATREMRSNQRQEIKASVSATTSREASEGTKSRFANINQGATLNLLFYQLTNVFRAGLFVDGLRFLFKPSTPLIWGTSAYDTQSFRLKDFGVLLERMARDPALFAFATSQDATSQVSTNVDAFVRTPSRVSLDQVVEDSLVGFDGVKASLLDKVVGTIADEYTNVRDDPAIARGGTIGATAGFAHAFVASGKAMEFGRAIAIGAETLRKALNGRAEGMLKRLWDVGRQRIGGTGLGPKELQRLLRLAEERAFDERLSHAEGFFKSLTRVNAPIEQHTLLVPSSATYLDAVVGALPATESYSEQMRALELRLRAARVKNQQALTEAIPSAAARIRDLRVTAKGNEVMGVTADNEG